MRNSNLPFDFDAIRKDLMEAMKVVGQKHGIAFTLGNIKYTDASFKTSLECFKASDSDLGKDPRVIKREADFRKNCFRANLDKAALGKTIALQGEQLIIRGWHGKSKVIFERKNGSLCTYNCYDLQRHVPDELRWRPTGGSLIDSSK